jgi:membrane protease YdiL (CAAX protease family)
LALLVPIAITIAGVCANVLYGAPEPSTNFVLASLPGIVPIFAASLLVPFSGAMGEELGWRGFALPRLLNNRSPLVATLILGILVAGWHTPLFVTGLYSQVPLRVLFIVATTILYTLIANGTGGSVLLAMLFHATLNTGAEFTFAWFSGADLERLIALYSLAGTAAALVAAVLAGRRLVRRSTTRQTLAPAPAAA